MQFNVLNLIDLIGNSQLSCDIQSLLLPLTATRVLGERWPLRIFIYYIGPKRLLDVRQLSCKWHNRAQTEKLTGLAAAHKDGAPCCSISTKQCFVVLQVVVVSCPSQAEAAGMHVGKSVIHYLFHGPLMHFTHVSCITSYVHLLFSVLLQPSHFAVYSWKHLELFSIYWLMLKNFKGFMQMNTL